MAFLPDPQAALGNVEVQHHVAPVFPDLAGLGLYLFPLRAGTKEPIPGTRGHLDAIPAEDFVSLGGNYGIALEQSGLLLVDVDDREAFSFADWFVPTLAQYTRRGEHYFYCVPKGYRGRNQRVPGGDIKVNGYAVGPGSVVNGFEYRLVNHPDECTIRPAPQALLDMCAISPDETPSATDSDGTGADYITTPGRDNELFAIGSLLRGRGYSRDFIAQTLANMPIEQPEGDKITSHDILRIAKSASRFAPGGADDLGINFQSSRLIPASEVDLVGRPIHWLVDDFIPKGELVMAYGASGIGKSTIGSWLAAQVTRAGRRFLFHGLEEPFERFSLRAVLGGGDRDNLFEYDLEGELFNFQETLKNLKP